jgi:hypothetical protein
MSVDESVDSMLTKLSNKLINLFEIGLVVNSRSSLDSFPHYSESHKIHTPSLKIIDVLIREWVLRIKMVLDWKIWCNFVHHIDTMVDHLSSMLISDNSAHVSRGHAR